MEPSQRVAVITGGGSGIGRAVGAAMARRGVAGVALVDMSEAVDVVAAKLNAEAGREVAVPYRGDATDEAFRGRVFDDIAGRFGPVSLCVPAAGITRDAWRGASTGPPARRASTRARCSSKWWTST